jgi:hypothetical protein
VSDRTEGPPQNDPAIADTDDLLRRVPNRPRMIATESDGRLRPSSAALELRDDETGCSVHVQGRLPNPLDPLIVLEGHSRDWGVATATAGDARDQDRHRVVGAPRTDPPPRTDDPAHAEVVPTTTSRTARKRNFGALAARMMFLREPVMASQDGID